MFWNKKNILIVLGMALTLAVVVANADYIFGTPTVIIPGQVDAPSVSTDGLSMYVEFTLPRLDGGRDLFVYTRETIHDDWSGPENLGPTINSPNGDAQPSISSDGLSLFFSSGRPDGYGNRDIYVSTRASLNDPWSEPENLGSTVNSSSWDSGPDISNDGLTLFFDSDRPGGYGLTDIWVTTRKTKDDDWGVPVNLGPIVNTSDNEVAPCISADGSILYWYYSFRNGHEAWEGNLRQVPIYTIIDFDSNGMVDINDLVIMIENWDTNEPSCDIAPAPFGNGIVNKNDLEILMSYWEQVVNVTAYWKLDETEGAVAYDSSGYYCDADVIGDPNWQPEDGMVDGAIELDGINNFIITPFTLNPADGSFSVFAWIKGGLPGQVILSQADGVNWLSTDTEGHLMTELKGGRGACDLISEVVIIDGDWHQVGFTWDGNYRILYVDDVIAAIDTQSCLEGSYDGLFIGAGSDLEEGTFFSGLIDDVRIYDRVITP